MAEINIEKKNSVWPWILAAIIVLLLIWLLVEAFDRDDVVVATADRPVVTEPAATTPALEAEPAAGAATAAGAASAAMERFAGTYSSDTMQLVLQADGSYTMQESPAGEAQGTWTHDAGANALQLTPADGGQDRYFRIEGDNALMPLNPDGQPAGQMAQLTRQGQD